VKCEDGRRTDAASDDGDREDGAVGWIADSFIRYAVLRSSRHTPVARFHPVLAGIRADRTDHLAFPCLIAAQWTMEDNLSRKRMCDACFTVAGTAHVCRRSHQLAARVSRLTAVRESYREHQNVAIILWCDGLGNRRRSTWILSAVRMAHSVRRLSGAGLDRIRRDSMMDDSCRA